MLQLVRREMFRLEVVEVLSLNGLSSLFSASKMPRGFLRLHTCARACCLGGGQGSCLLASIIETSQNDRSEKKSNVAELRR